MQQQCPPWRCSDLNKNLRSASTIDIPVGAATPKNGQYYAPENAQLPANSKVTWINKDNIPHTSQQMITHLIQTL